MSMLFPWFALAAATVAAPLILHLIRRDVRGERVFSTIRFLTPASPPPTQKKKLENLLLLLMRAAILLLLALMFARPFFRSSEPTELSRVAKRIAILVDVSASMSAVERTERTRDLLAEILASAQPEDRIKVFAVGSNVNSIAGSWTADTPRISVASLTDSLQSTFEHDNLPAAVQEVLAEHQSTLDRDETLALPLVVHLISDFSTEFSPDWQRISWPSHARIELHRVQEEAGEAIAWLELLEPEQTRPLSSFRIRVSNGRDSQQERIDLVVDGQSWDETLTVGRGRSVVVEIPAQETEQVVQIAGASHAGGTLILPPSRPNEFLMGCWTEEDGDSEWILRQALASNDAIEMNWQSFASSLNATELSFDGLVALTPPDEENLPAFQRHLDQDKSVVLCLLGAESTERIEEWQAFIDQLLPSAKVTLATNESRAFRLLRGVRPLNASSESSPYDTTLDFGQTRVWMSGSMSWQSDSGVSLGELDDGSSWLARFDLPAGRVYLMTLGWTATHSQLARSSRFPILMSTLVGLTQRGSPFELRGIGDSVEEYSLVNSSVPEPSQSSAESPSTRIELPGFYQRDTDVSAPGLPTAPKWMIAQVASEEWRWSEGSLREIQNAGLPRSNSANAREAEATLIKQRVADEQLENEQQLWRWLILIAGVVLGFEAFVSWSASRFPPASRA